MIERLEKISAELFKNALKTYTAKDVLTHKRAHALNVPEMLSLYPNHGVGFIIRKKDWAKGIHYEIRRAVYKVPVPLSSPTVMPPSTESSQVSTTRAPRKWDRPTRIASRASAREAFGPTTLAISSHSKTIME